MAMRQFVVLACSSLLNLCRHLMKDGRANLLPLIIPKILPTMHLYKSYCNQERAVLSGSYPVSVTMISQASRLRIVISKAAATEGHI